MSAAQAPPEAAPGCLTRLARAVALLVLAGALLAGALAGHFLHWAGSPIEALSEDSLVVEVDEGQGWEEVIAELRQQGLVTRVWHFRALVRLNEAGPRLRPGRYEIPTGASPEELLARLTRSGPDGTVRLTIPEGFTMFHVADRVEAEGLATRQEFLAIATDKALLRELGIRGPSVEGHLFPDTYFIDPGTSPRAIVRRMVRRHRQVWEKMVKEVGPEKVAALQKEAGLSTGQLLILASIVEREAVVHEERPVISRVFLNRIARGMKLQTDPTCIYGPTLYKEKPSPKTCRDKTSRYSTYVIEGLPPGPIANPGRASIRAALLPTDKPEEREYLYFVARPDGRRHTFSKTYEDHQKAIPR